MPIPHPPAARPGHPAPGAAVPAAGDLMAELGGAFCPSLSGLLERLIDRQAADPRGARP
jgi:hypothetical protein